MKLIGRARELRLLTERYEQIEAQFVILYGRRRIGKTALIRAWTESDVPPDDRLYWVAIQTSTVNQLRAFSQALFRFASPSAQVDESFSYTSWEAAFSVAAEQAATRRMVLVLDEFTYVLQANPEVASILQNVWDQKLKQGRMMLVLSGSLAGMIQRHVLDYQAPLYGRATARLKLQPLTFGQLTHWLPGMTPEQRVAVYAVTGGVPAYLERFDDRLSVRDNLLGQVVTSTNLMLTDAVFLLREQLVEPRNYMAILEAIAAGNHKLTDVARRAGLERTNANKYLSVLQELGYVKRLVPVTVRHPERSRKGRFVITDAYLRFYFRFLRPHLDDIEMGRVRQVRQLLERHLTDFIGTHTFEEICREWVRVKSDLGELPFFASQVGSHWSKTAQVDVVGVNWQDRQILLGECKWGRRPWEFR